MLTSFVVKRSLVLGASGREVYFPGAIEGSNGYGKERKILEPVGINTSEFPFDIMLSSLWLVIVFYVVVFWMPGFFESELELQMPTEHRIALIVEGVLMLLLYGGVYWRRRRSRRC